MAETRHHPRGAVPSPLRRQRGKTIETGVFAVTPESLILTLRLRFGTLVWQRPSVVFVQQGGRTTRLPIHDATRLAQGALVGVVVLLGLIARRIIRHS
jgi:hypothetical protein